MNIVIVVSNNEADNGLINVLSISMGVLCLSSITNEVS